METTLARSMNHLAAFLAGPRAALQRVAINQTAVLLASQAGLGHGVAFIVGERVLELARDALVKQASV
jgi:hypothetical protein